MKHVILAVLLLAACQDGRPRATMCEDNWDDAYDAGIADSQKIIDAMALQIANLSQGDTNE